MITYDYIRMHMYCIYAHVSIAIELFIVFHCGLAKTGIQCSFSKCAAHQWPQTAFLPLLVYCLVNREF